MIPKPLRIAPSWESFCVEQAGTTDVAGAWLADNFVHRSVPGPVTHYNLIKIICGSALRPIPVISICDELHAISLPRGYTLSKLAGDHIDRIVSHYDQVVWWITDDGLHVELSALKTMVHKLSPFDKVAGPLVIANWEEVSSKGKTHLPAEALMLIAIELDRSGLTVLDNLQPAQRDALGSHNQRAGKKTDKSFEETIQNKRFVRFVRRRLYVARERYQMALKTEPTGEPAKIPESYYSSYTV
jgi:hypothetical protein